MQAHSVGMHVCRKDICKALVKVMQHRIKNVYYKSETTLPFKAELGQENGFIYGQTNDNRTLENWRATVRTLETLKKVGKAAL